MYIQDIQPYIHVPALVKYVCTVCMYEYMYE